MVQAGGSGPLFSYLIDFIAFYIFNISILWLNVAQFVSHLNYTTFVSKN